MSDGEISFQSQLNSIFVYKIDLIIQKKKTNNEQKVQIF